MTPTAAKKRFFTAEQANSMLPLVRAIVGDIVQLYTDIHERRRRMEIVRQRRGETEREADVYSEETAQVEQELEKDIERLDEFVTELTELGVELKDPISGLIDFPAMMDDREVYLCWKLGEKDVAFWHELDAGFQGRQMLLENTITTEGEDEEN